MDKLLQLIFEFATAPAELKDSATDHKANLDRMGKAQVQLKLWEREYNDALGDSNKSGERLSRQLKNWTPAAEVKKELEEITPKVKAEK